MPIMPGISGMSVDMSLFLQNVYAAFVNQQYQHAQFLLEYAMKLSDTSALASLLDADVSIGLHRGCVREANEDCVLAVHGTTPLSHSFGLFVVCDGMGGHTHGQEAAHLAIRTLLEYMLPLFMRNTVLSDRERFFVDGIQQANRAIYVQNQLLEQQLVACGVPIDTAQIRRMGTTITAVLLFDGVAYVANVGDSRTYLYDRSDRSLKKVTKDHSLVAQFLADGLLQEEEIYTHPQRNQITRALGTEPFVTVDTFVVPLRGDEILLLCSDGVWEMLRDRAIEKVLASPWAHASSMTDQLVRLANDGGGADNIGCIVIQFPKRPDISTMKTALLDPVEVLTRLTSS